MKFWPRLDQIFLDKIPSAGHNLRMSGIVRHGKWHILHQMLCLCNRMSDQHWTVLAYTGENHHPAIFHTDTFRPKRLEPGLLYNTSSITIVLTNIRQIFSDQCRSGFWVYYFMILTNQGIPNQYIQWWRDPFMCNTDHIRSYNVKSHCKVQGVNSTPE